MHQPWLSARDIEKKTSALILRLTCHLVSICDPGFRSLRPLIGRCQSFWIIYLYRVITRPFIGFLLGMIRNTRANISKSEISIEIVSVYLDMDNAWKKIWSRLRRGYQACLIPRDPGRFIRCKILRFASKIDVRKGLLTSSYHDGLTCHLNFWRI